MKNKLSFTKPESWIEIAPSRFDELNIKSTDLTPCLYAFATKSFNGDANLITINDFSVFGEDYLADLDKQYSKLNLDREKIERISKYIKDDPKNSFTHFNSMTCVYNKFHTLNNNKCYVCILGFKSGEDFLFTLQVFVEIKNSIFCFNTAIKDPPKTHTLETVINNHQHVNDLFKFVIKKLKLS